MSPAQYREFWRHVSTEPITPPIPYTCPRCQYTGQIARVCDVPGFCLFCGHALGKGVVDRLTQLVRTAMDRKADREVKAWRELWIAPTTADENALVECARGHTYDSAKHGNCPECESETDLSYELAKDDAAEAR